MIERNTYLYTGPVSVNAGALTINAHFESAELTELDRCTGEPFAGLIANGAIFFAHDGEDFEAQFMGVWSRGCGGDICAEYDDTDFTLERWNSRTGYHALTEKELAALDAAAGGNLSAALGAAMQAAAESAVADVTPVIDAIEAHDKALIDESAGRVESIPTWALCALAYGDYSGLSEEDAAALDNWIKAQDDINVTCFSCVNEDDRGRYYIPGEDEEINRYFDTCPAFGLPADCESVFFLYSEGRRHD